MGIAWLAFVAMAPTPGAVALHSQIVSASIYKPGLAFIVREVTIPAGKGHYKVDFLPDALDGSFWFGGDGVKIDGVQTTLRFVEEKTTVKATSISEYLQANVGRPVTLIIQKPGPDAGTETIKGTISMPEEYSPVINRSLITILLTNGNLRQIDFGAIRELKTTGLKSTYVVKQKRPIQQISFDADAPRATRVGFITLEPGAAWSSSYAVILNDEAHASVSAKAQIGVGPLRFVDTNVTVVAGLPNLPSTVKYDLAAGYGSLQAYLRGTQDAYRDYRPGAGDPYTLLEGYVQQLRQSRSPQVYGGGYGGNGITYLTYDPTDNSIVFRGGEPGAAYGREDRGMTEMLAAARVEDVFAYPMGKLSMEPGDRVAKMLVNDQAEYRRVYRWRLDGDSSKPVVKLIRLKNAGKAPWTGGICLVMKNGLPLAQIAMPFTAPGRDADLELGQAQDITTDRQSEDVGREEVVGPRRQKFIAVSIKETLLVTNDTTESATVEIRYDFTGLAVEAEGAKVQARGEKLVPTNLSTTVTWEVELKPGEKKVLTLLKKVLV